MNYKPSFLPVVSDYKFKFKSKFFIFPKNTSEATHFNNTLNTYKYQWEGKQKKQCLSRCLPRDN